MTIVVEDGTGLSSAVSYASVTELATYATHRLDIASYSTAQKEAALVIASIDWLDGQHSFIYEPSTTTQALKFPVDIDEEATLPQAVKNATMKAALLHLQGLLLVDLTGLNVAGSIESEDKKLGPLEKSVKYKSGTAQRYSRVLPAELERLLYPYTGGGMGQAVRL